MTATRIQKDQLTQSLTQPPPYCRSFPELTRNDQVPLGILQRLGRLVLVTVGLLHHQLDVGLVDLDRRSRRLVCLLLSVRVGCGRLVTLTLVGLLEQVLEALRALVVRETTLGERTLSSLLRRSDLLSGGDLSGRRVVLELRRRDVKESVSSEPSSSVKSEKRTLASPNTM